MLIYQKKIEPLFKGINKKAYLECWPRNFASIGNKHCETARSWEYFNHQKH